MWASTSSPGSFTVSRSVSIVASALSYCSALMYAQAISYSASSYIGLCRCTRWYAVTDAISSPLSIRMRPIASSDSSRTPPSPPPPNSWVSVSKWPSASPYRSSAVWATPM